MKMIRVSFKVIYRMMYEVFIRYGIFCINYGVSIFVIINGVMKYIRIVDVGSFCLFRIFLEVV